VSNSRYSRIPAYGVLNLSAGMGIVTGGATLWELSVWAQNALDKRYYLAVNNNPTLAGTYYASAGQSRTLGVSLKTDF
jgi:iron complex outermembrane recepter protein